MIRKISRDMIVHFSELANVNVIVHLLYVKKEENKEKYWKNLKASIFFPLVAASELIGPFFFFLRQVHSVEREVC